MSKENPSIKIRPKNNFFKSKLFTLLSLVFLLIIMGCAVNPVTGEKEFSVITEAQELAIGKQNYPVTTQINNGIFQDERLQIYVDKVGGNLASFSHRPNLPYEFNVVNSSTINAYALPGGKISITRGLLSKLENEDQLAGILGHEIGHIAARHSASQMSKQVLAGAVVAGFGAFLAAGDVKNRELYTMSSSIAAGLLLLRYSRVQETQSDYLGLEYMARAGYNPTGYLEAMKIIQHSQKTEPSRIKAMFRSHPLTSERVERIKVTINSTYSNHATRPFKVQQFMERTDYINSLKEAYAHYDNGDRFIARRDFKRAEKEYKSAINLDNRQSVFHMGLAWTLLSQKKFNQARISIRTSIRLYPDLFPSRFLAGIISYRLGDYNRALVDLKEADILIPSVPDVRLYKARCYEKLGNISKAIENYKDVVRIAPDSKEAGEAIEKLMKWGVIRKGTTQQ